MNEVCAHAVMLKPTVTDALIHHFHLHDAWVATPQSQWIVCPIAYSHNCWGLRPLLGTQGLTILTSDVSRLNIYVKIYPSTFSSIQTSVHRLLFIALRYLHIFISTLIYNFKPAQRYILVFGLVFNRNFIFPTHQILVTSCICPCDPGLSSSERVFETSYLIIYNFSPLVDYHHCSFFPRWHQSPLKRVVECISYTASAPPEPIAVQRSLIRNTLVRQHCPARSVHFGPSAHHGCPNRAQITQKVYTQAAAEGLTPLQQQRIARSSQDAAG